MGSTKGNETGWVARPTFSETVDTPEAKKRRLLSSIRETWAERGVDRDDVVRAVTYVLDQDKISFIGKNYCFYKGKKILLKAA